MKNLFLTVVLLLTVSFAFAANDVKKISTTNVGEVFETINSNELVNNQIITEFNSPEFATDGMDFEFPVYWDLGNGDSGSFTMSGDGSMEDILNVLLAIFFP